MKTRTPLLVLAGLRGCGKSTLARTIAGMLGLPHADLDERVLERLGVETVAEAWSRDGEPAFREAETACLTAALEEPGPLVLALGGGTPTAPGAADALREAALAGRCLIVYLRLPPETLAARLAGDDPDRPSLTGTDAVAEIGVVFDARDPLYRELATHEHAPTTGVGADARAVAALWAGGSTG